MMFKSFAKRIAVLAILHFCTTFSLHATPVTSTVFAETFDLVIPVVEPLSQVIYYREHSDSAKQAGAHVFVDGEFHTTLLPGGFTRFCLRAGHHTLGAYFNAGTQYPGKVSDRFTALFTAGKTYFLRVREDGLTVPQPVRRDAAEQELKLMQRQAHMLSRASTVVPCVFDPERRQPVRHYTINLDVLFGASALRDSKLTTIGREAVVDLALNLRQDLRRINRVSILSPSESGGDEVFRLKRANAIRNQLIRNAIPGEIVEISQQDNIADTAKCASGCAVPKQHISVWAN